MRLSLCSRHARTQDILEKIRECGSSVTYYGGRVLNNQSPEMSPMTKAIMREIHNDDNVCEVCQPNKCPHGSKIFTSFCGRGADNKHLGKIEPIDRPSLFLFNHMYLPISYEITFNLIKF